MIAALYDDTAAKDLEKAKRKGLGRLVKEIAHDAETGAPKLKLQDNVAIRELTRRALKDLAEIRGLTRDQPPPPPKPNLTLWPSCTCSRRR
jgi:hypothetical protein